jgi:hypothetical protein
MRENENASRRRSEIRIALQKLTNGAGVWREDLLGALKSSELGVLQRCWSVNTGNGIQAARDTVIANLQSHVDRLIFSPKSTPDFTLEQQRARYKHSVLVSFNASRYPFLIDADITTRRLWLEKRAPKDLRVSVSTSQRYVTNAISQIEQQILESAYQPVSEAWLSQDETSVFTTPEADSDPEATPIPAPKETTPRPKHRRTLILSTTGVVVLAAAAIVVLPPLLHPKPTASANSAPTQQQSTSTSSSVPVVSSATGPVRVGSIAISPNDLGTGYSYAFANQLPASDLPKLNSLVSSGGGYSSWLMSQGGVVPYDVQLQIQIQSNTSQIATITDLQIVKHCGAPPTGTLVYEPGASGGSSDISIEYDLDQIFPVAEDADTHESYFAGATGHTIVLDPKNPVTLEIDATTSKQDCKFSFNALIDTADGKRLSEVIDNHGKPFEVSALAISKVGSGLNFSAYRTIFSYDGNSNAFVSVNPKTYNGG